MGQDVTDDEYGIRLVLAQADRDGRSVLPADHAVQGERQGQPLVFLDATVVMGIQVNQKILFVEGILLDVQPGRVNVRAEDVHAVLNVPRTDVEQGNGLAELAQVHLIARLEGRALLYILITGCFGVCDDPLAALPLRFSRFQKGLVAFDQFFVHSAHHYIEDNGLLQRCNIYSSGTSNSSFSARISLTSAACVQPSAWYVACDSFEE